MAGRPTKYNEEVVQRITQALRAGNTRRASCAYAGISEDSFSRWMQDNATFADAIKKAEGDAEVRNVAIIQKAADTTWQAAAWWLERKHKAEWSSRIEQTGADGSPVKVIVEYADKATDA
jgi:transposase